MDVKISASLMCANLLALGDSVGALEEAGVDWLHFDIMDGMFVPNFALGPLEMRALRSHTRLPFDVHLMINQPERYLELFADAGANVLTIHAEACRSPLRTLQAIRTLGMKPGLALSPTTSADSLRWMLPYIDLVLVMTVEPGFAGQAFIPSMVVKVNEIRQMIELTGRNIEIQVDGNINSNTIPTLTEAGATVLVGGSSGLFNGKNTQRQAVEEMRRLAAPSSLLSIEAENLEE
jgi:ribulose-phosphate 3-epimerase